MPWSIRRIDTAQVRLPDGRLFAGDPHWDNGLELELPPGVYDVAIVLASHPLSPIDSPAAADLTVRSEPVTMR